MTRYRFPLGLLVLAVICLAGTVSVRLVDGVLPDRPAHSQTHANAPTGPSVDVDLPMPSAACVDADGSWKNWGWANVPMLSPRCNDGR